MKKWMKKWCVCLLACVLCLQSTAVADGEAAPYAYGYNTIYTVMVEKTSTKVIGESEFIATCSGTAEMILQEYVNGKWRDMSVYPRKFASSTGYNMTLNRDHYVADSTLRWKYTVTATHSKYGTETVTEYTPVFTT